MSFDEIKVPVFLKFFLIGGGLAFFWLLMFVISGAVWSLTHTNTLGFIDHLYNGFVFATLMNLLSIFLGFSIGLSVLLNLTKNFKINSVFIGFAVIHFCIIGVIWSIGALDFRTDPLPDRIIDRVINLNELLEKND